MVEKNDSVCASCWLPIRAAQDKVVVNGVKTYHAECDASAHEGKNRE
jgi:hypothetical protein